MFNLVLSDYVDLGSPAPLRVVVLNLGPRAALCTLFAVFSLSLPRQILFRHVLRLNAHNWLSHIAQGLELVNDSDAKRFRHCSLCPHVFDSNL